MHLDIAALHLVTPSQMSAQSSQTAPENIQQLHLRDNGTTFFFIGSTLSSSSHLSKILNVLSHFS